MLLYTVFASDEPGGKRNRTLIMYDYVPYIIFIILYLVIYMKKICRIRVTHARNTCERSLFAHLNNTTIQSTF